jgi:hypothetical protein
MEIVGRAQGAAGRAAGQRDLDRTILSSHARAAAE